MLFHEHDLEVLNFDLKLSFYQHGTAYTLCDTMNSCIIIEVCSLWAVKRGSLRAQLTSILDLLCLFASGDKFSAFYLYQLSRKQGNGFHSRNCHTSQIMGDRNGNLYERVSSAHLLPIIEIKFLLIVCSLYVKQSYSI